MNDLKIKYVDLGNTLIISTNKKGLEEMEKNLTQLSSRFADVKFQHADYLDPEIIGDLRFSSRKNRIEIRTQTGYGWDFEVDPGTWSELKERISELHDKQQRRIMLHSDEEAIPSYKMYLELEEEEALVGS